LSSGEAVRMRDSEAAEYDEPADHGLRGPVVRQAWRNLLLVPGGRLVLIEGSWSTGAGLTRQTPWPSWPRSEGGVWSGT
jgi:hypothetical protein